MITDFKLYESFLTDKTKIKKWLISMYIFDYTINDDLTVDIYGDVDISNNKLTEIPFQFGTVNGTFYCYNNQLTSLKGCPKMVNGHFSCNFNKLTNLKDPPSKITGHFTCYNNSLEDINDLDSKILIKSITSNLEWLKQIKQEVWDKYFEYWITKDSSIIKYLENKVSDNIKQKYSYYFNASNFDLI